MDIYMCTSKATSGRSDRTKPAYRRFKSVAATQRFCRVYDEVRHVLPSPSPRRRRLSLSERCWFHLRRVNRLLGILERAA